MNSEIHTSVLGFDIIIYHDNFKYLSTITPEGGTYPLQDWEKEILFKKYNLKD